MNETLHTMFPRGVQEDTRPDDIGVDEILGRINASIDVRFGREIDNGVELMLEHERVHGVGIRNVGFEKFVTFAMFIDHAVEIGEVAGIC